MTTQVVDSSTVNPIVPENPSHQKHLQPEHLPTTTTAASSTTTNSATDAIAGHQHDLYHNDNTTNSSFDSDDEHDDLGYDITEFDLDVVDDALLNPNSKEYMDHFGFKIQVRTDDEESSDDDSMNDYNSVSDSVTQKPKDSLDEEDEDDVVKRATRTNFSSISTSSVTPNTTAATTTTTTTNSINDDDEYGRSSIDTHITSPQSSMTFNLQEDKLQSCAEQEQHTVPNHSINSSADTATNTTGTINTSDINESKHAPSSVPILRSPPESSNRITQENETTSVSAIASALNNFGMDEEDEARLIEENVNQYSARLEERISSSSSRSAGHNTSLTSNSNRRSIFSSITNTFYSPSAPTSAPATTLQRTTSSASSLSRNDSTISRPSQSYQQRQSVKQHRQSVITSPRSPTGSLMSPIVSSSGSSSNGPQPNFEQLVSSYKRLSHQDHKVDSDQHLALKKKALTYLQQIMEEHEDRHTIDWAFWESVINNFGEIMDNQYDTMQQHLVEGIPPSLRGYIWQVISKSSDQSFRMIDNDNMAYYTDILVRKSTSHFEKQIQRDVPRTFPGHPFFKTESGKRSLFNVAKAYSLFDQEVGYCQGLSHIIGCLLIHMSFIMEHEEQQQKDEQEGEKYTAQDRMEYATFCVLVKLMGKYGLRGHFTPHMNLLHQHLYQFDNVFQQKLPVVHRHLEKEGVTPSMYASQWFITLFSYCNQQQKQTSNNPVISLQQWMAFSFRIMDLLFVEGTHILIQIALALVIRNQEKLLEMKFERLIGFLCHDIFSVYNNTEEAGTEQIQIDVDKFVKDVYRVDLPPKFMARLAQQYRNQQQQRGLSDLVLDDLDTHAGTTTTRMSMASRPSTSAMTQEENLRRINGQLSEHIRSVEGSLQALRQENLEITNQVINSKMDMARAEDEKEQLRYELTQVRAEFDQYKRRINQSFDERVKTLEQENNKLAETNVALANQLTDTETMLIELKMQFAERESEFEALKRELKAASRK